MIDYDDGGLMSTPITDEQIEALAQEADFAGDEETVRDCRRALKGSAAARLRLAKLIADAAARAS